MEENSNIAEVKPKFCFDLYSFCSNALVYLLDVPISLILVVQAYKSVHEKLKLEFLSSYAVLMY